MIWSVKAEKVDAKKISFVYSKARCNGIQEWPDSRQKILFIYLFSDESANKSHKKIHTMLCDLRQMLAGQCANVWILYKISIDRNE